MKQTILALIILVCVGCHHIPPDPSSNMPSGFPIVAPDGYKALCKRRPTLCCTAKHCKISYRQETKLTVEAWDVLNDVNLDVRWESSYKTDIDNYGVVDYWNILGPDGDSDCEDRAITKMARLFENPLINKNSLRLVRCFTENYGGHVVLLIQTDKGDYILDNRTEFILSWADSFFDGYTWRSMSVPNSRRWESIEVMK